MAGRGKKKPRVNINNKFINTGSAKKSRDGSFMIFGRKPILEQMASNPDTFKAFYVVDNAHDNSTTVAEIIEFAKEKRIRVEYINETTAIGKVGKVNMQGIVAQVEKYKYSDHLE